MAPFAECLECRRIGPLVADLPAQVANLQGDCEALRAEANAAKVGFLDRLAGAQYTLQLINVDRTALREYLAGKDIPAMIYYPIPLHLQKAYSYYGYQAGDFKVSEMLAQQCISLPMHTELTHAQQDFICQSILDFYK